MNSIAIKSYAGQAIYPLISQVAQFRIDGFRSYPYLYDGSLSYEKKYLSSYGMEPDALLVCAWSGDELAAIATSLPLASGSGIVADAPDIFRANDLNPDHFYYYAEIIVKPEFRAQGIARDIYKIRQSHAQSLSKTALCLAVVDRPENHPLRPGDYISPERIWQREGFQKSGMSFSFNWPTIQPDGKVIDQQNRMIFWTKTLSPTK